MITFREATLDQLSIDHTIEVNSLTGTARLSVPIRTSPGRESFGPSLALGYGSGERNSTFGVGWFLSGVPSIGLDTGNVLPTYRQQEDRYVYAGGQELVPSKRKQGDQWLPVVETRGAYRVQRFRCRTERSFERFEQWTHQTTGRAHWVVFARNGVVSVFGKTNDNSTRIADPADPDWRTFQWLLEAQYHPKGNAIVYDYKAEDGAGVDATLSFETRRVRSGGGLAQRYLKRVLYANSKPLSHENPFDPANEWRHEIVFDYGEHRNDPVPTPSDASPAPPWSVRHDPFSTHRPGFEIRTYRLCRRILMFHRFPELGGAPCLVAATELRHREDPAGSVLEQITYRGYRRDIGSGTTSDRAIPPLKLSYSRAETAVAFETPEAADNVPSGFDGAVYQWIDLKNEGLPGILCAQRGNWYFKENLGDGRFGPLMTVEEVPAAVSAAFQLQDFDGDGNLNLVGFEGREAGFYQLHREDGRWRGFQTFRGLPRVDFVNARVQWVDLNGDGHPDLIIDHGDRLVWYPSEATVGFASPIEIARPDTSEGGAPTLTQDGRLHTFFADMTGDGLLDMVRVDNGRVEFWPNLGHGCFGSGVVMEDAPVIDGFDEMDASRLRFVDLDGSGAADLLYIGRGEIRYWNNQSGNRFGAENRLSNLPYIDRLSSAQVFDFLGDGTRCLVWSTPLPTHEGQAIQYLRLTGALPPRMLISVSNSVGQETRFSYRSSAREYLRDKRSERPWRSLLPRHSMVVESLEGLDLIAGSRMVSRYEYRDGYFDDDERRFIGFGLVDSYDTDLLRATGTAAPEEVTPPSLVRSWYHTGSDNGFAKRAVDFYGQDALAARLPDPAIEGIAELSTEEQLDGYRALAGVQWRQEFYTIRSDGTRELHPLRTTEFGYRIRMLQPLDTERDAVFSFIQSELLRYEYEQDPSDPRVTHDVLVESDTYGDVAKRALFAYPRRLVGPHVRPEQQVLHAELSVTTHTSLDSPNRFEVGIEISERRYALTGITRGANAVVSRESLLTQVEVALANQLAFHEIANGGGPEARLIGQRRNLFWNDSRSAVLPESEVGSPTLLHHVERAVMPEAAVDGAYGGRVSGQVLSDDGHYRRADGFWWAEDTAYRYRDAAAFYRLSEEASTGGSRQAFTFDSHFLLVTAVEDVFGNRIESTPDYQVLASSRIRDANDNFSEVLYDPLGFVIVMGLRGRQLGGDGNPHPVGAEDLTSYVPQVVNTAALLNDPARFLQDANRFLFYDPEAFERGDGPSLSVIVERERHVHDGEGTAPSASRIRVTVSYVDGFGRPVQTKLRVDAGPAIQRDLTGVVVVDVDGEPVLAGSAERWLTSGNDLFNNKGWLVRKYEPLFSSRPNYEPDEALRRYGVATRTHYDPVGRVIRQDLPNGTFFTSAYTAWEIRQSDPNDNVAGSDYEASRHSLPASDPERAALTKAQAHARTPTLIEADVLGRPFRVRELGEGGTERVTTTIYGVLGLPDRVVDPRNLEAFTYRYDMLGRELFEHSMDGGDRWTLLDAQGRAIHRWDGRDVHTRHLYDQNGRLVETRVDGALGLDNVVERVVYGDNPVVAQAQIKNARGRVVEQYDDAGVLVFDRYHIDGQPIDFHRSLRNEYKATVDWSTPAMVAIDAVQHSTQTRLDGFGRIVAQTQPDGATREYEYARLGHVSEVRLTTADGQLNRKIIATGIETNARSQRTRMRFGNGVETSYEYDTDSFRLKRLYTHLVVGASRDYLDVGYNYDPVGNITRWVDRVQDPGATTPMIQGLTTSSACEFTYDSFYQLKIATGRVHQALLEHDYRFGLTDPNAIKGTRHLSLNNGAAVERYTRAYDYDLAGNIQRIRHQGVTQSWNTEIWTSPTSNRSLPRKDLNGIDVVNPETRFDENGNTIHLPHLRSMQWNHVNRLARAVIIDRSAAGNSDDAEYYVYGADGLRVRRVTERLVSGQVEVTETTYFDGCEIRRISRVGNTRLLRQTSHITDGTQRLATLHEWSIDQTGLETDDITAKKLHYLIGNHLGSVALELDEAGDVISYEEYFPFGGSSFIAGRNARDVKLKDYRYSGKVCDDATGFYCYEYRYYAPFIGNWLSPDPLGPVDGLNLYRFVRNNPIRFIDSDGLQTNGEIMGLGPMGLTEAQAINYFNWTVGFEGGFRIEDLSRDVRPGSEGGWILESVKPLEAADIQALQELEARLAGEILKPEDLFRSPEELLGGLATSNDATEGDESGAGQPSEDPGTSGDNVDVGGEGVSVHPADGSSGTGSTQKGKTGESGSNGSGTTGQGPGSSQKGQGSSGGGDGAANGRGTATGAKQGADGAGGSAQPGRAGGRPGGTGNGASAQKHASGNTGDGAVDIPAVPPGFAIGTDGIPFSPEMELPEVIPEAGTPLPDQSQARFGTGDGRDPRGDPGADAGSGFRPGGTEGGEGKGTGAGSADGQEGEQPGERRGMKGGRGEHELPEWLSWIDTALDSLQTGLDVIGVVPGLGEIADGINGLISLARGDYAGAALSFAAMIPFAGWAATAGKFGRRAVTAVAAGGDLSGAVTKYGDAAASVVSTASRNADKAAQFASKNADELGGSVGRRSSTSGGTATVHYRPNADKSPHWTVETNIPGQPKLETHQIIPSRGKTQVLEVKPGAFPKPPAASRTVDLPDAGAARRMQQDQLDRGDTGQWIREANSCATVVCEVVSAGGGRFPSDPAQAGHFLRMLFGISR